MTLHTNDDETYSLLNYGYPLAADRPDYEEDGSPMAGLRPRPKPAWFRNGNGQSALTWVLVLLVVVAATDGVALFWMSRIMNTVYADLSTSDLEFANPYHGLDALYRSGNIEPPVIEPIQNIPRVVAQVFTDRPNELAPVGEHDLFDKVFGTLSPHEKHLHVTPNTHTIAQFRALDFGMEECSLVIQLPENEQSMESNEPFLFNPVSVFDVFRLEAPKPLDVRKLSYRTKPPVKERVATIVAKMGEETPVTRFPCVWGSLHTFEVACAKDSECLVNVWSSQNTTYGVYMYQHQTV